MPPMTWAEVCQMYCQYGPAAIMAENLDPKNLDSVDIVALSGRRGVRLFFGAFLKRSFRAWAIEAANWRKERQAADRLGARRERPPAPDRSDRRPRRLRGLSDPPAGEEYRRWLREHRREPFLPLLLPLPPPPPQQ